MHAILHYEPNDKESSNETTISNEIECMNCNPHEEIVKGNKNLVSMEKESEKLQEFKTKESMGSYTKETNEGFDNRNGSTIAEYNTQSLPMDKSNHRIIVHPKKI